MITLGVDPGLDGALCIYDSSAHTADILSTPTVNVVVNKKKKRRLDYAALAAWLDIRRHGIDMAVIEQVGAGTGQGVTSMFAFGELYGAARMLMAANAIKTLLVLPVVWKSRFALLRQGKDASIAKATELAPHLEHHWPLKKHDGRAEAFLLAVYGSRMQ